MRARLREALAATVAVLGAAAPASAQGFRITGVSTGRYVGLRPWVDDSISVDSTDGDGALRLSTRDVVVRCTPGEPFCRYRRSADEPVAAVPLMQDLAASVWGIGQGIQLHAHARARTSAGNARTVWPRWDDHFDILAAYAEIDRARYRARAGRQFLTNGLGFYNFDGGSLTILPVERVALELYGGWSLERGINEPVTSGEIAALEPLAPDSRGVLFGVAARARPTDAISLGAVYQRDGRADRGGLYSERLAGDAEWRVGSYGSVSGDLELDLATGFVNQAWLRAQMPVRDGFTLVADVRRYRPFFELWTIWGVFSPVGYTEGNAGTLWQTPDARLSLDAHGGWRRYDETKAGLESQPLKEDGWHLEFAGTWRARNPWLVHAGWRTEIGFGASRTDLDGGVRWAPDRWRWVGLRLAAFQSAYELRVGTGRVVGLVIDAGTAIRYDVRLAGDLGVYRNTFADMSPVTDWSQTRAALRLEWTVGGDPGMAGTGWRRGGGGR